MYKKNYHFVVMLGIHICFSATKSCNLDFTPWNCSLFLQDGRTFFAGAIYSAVLSNEPGSDTFITFPIGYE